MPLLIKGAHLIGGSLSYQCLGNNEYRFTLRIYRDCAGGGAAFDQTANLAVYDIGNNLVLTQSPVRGPSISVPLNSTNNPCLVTPAGLCSEYTEYVTTMVLPPILGGYTIAHQRCCRNGTISNVANSSSLGNTYFVTIPSLDSVCNSTPEFAPLIPPVICANEALNLQIQAQESDGDSLYYELCEVYTGGGQMGGAGCNSVIPIPTCPPPFTPINLISPYTFSQPLPSTSGITLNPLNGTLTGMPNLTGQFSVGVCVSEWRNGLLMSTARLDYQFNIVNCISNLVAEMLTPDVDPTILCDGLTVQFQNLSSNFNTLFWDFGVQGILSDTSRLPNPIFTFPDTGVYRVSLVLNPGSPCTDTTFYDFKIRPNVSGNIGWSGIPCFEVQGIDWKSTGIWPDSTTFQWNFGGGASPAGWVGEIPPPVSWSSPGWKTVSFTAFWPTGCSFNVVDSIEISSLSLSVDAGPDQTIEFGDTAILNASGGVSYYWYSNLPARYNDRYSSQIFTWPQGDTTIYYVEATDALGCKGIDSVRVFMLRDQIESPLIINFISPNSDGRNDFLDLTNLLKDRNGSLQIFNRWGAEVYSVSPYLNNWEGDNKGGDPLPDGTYYFTLRIEGEYVYKGAITILRGL